MPEEESPISHLLGGAAAGLVADSCTHPIDTMRTRLQVQRGTSPTAYKGTADVFFSIIKNEGYLAFYKGFGIVAASTIPAHALYFAGYEMAKRTLSPGKTLEEKGPLVHFAAGIWADICGSFVWVPQDIIKQRLQVQRSKEGAKYKNSAHALRTILAEEGIRGLYKGYWPAVVTYGPFVGIYFTCYEQLKRLCNKYYKAPTSDDLPMIYNLTSGGLAGAIAAAITCPMDVVKTRLQVESTKTEGRYKNAFDAITRITREEGIKAFGKGMTPRMLWIAPSTAITIAAYEQFKKLF